MASFHRNPNLVKKFANLLMTYKLAIANHTRGKKVGKYG